MTRILGVDPGRRSGVAILSSAGKTTAPTLEHYEEVYGGSDGFRQWWADTKPYVGVDLIVCESFTLREGTHGVDLSPVEVIESLKGLARDAGVPVLYSPPGGRLKRVPDRVVKNLGMWLPGQRWRNAREAIRHSLAYFKMDGNNAVLRAFEEG